MRPHVIDDSEQNPPVDEVTPFPTPGKILKDMFLDPLGISQYRLAQATGLSESQVAEIVEGDSAITARVARRFAAFFGTSAEMWLRMQAVNDLRAAQAEDLSWIQRHDALTG